MHWVGDGFPVQNLFAYDRLGQAISPFLMLDYAAPYPFEATKAQRGVGSHPHRGFETVTLAYQVPSPIKIRPVAGALFRLVMCSG